ncbi:hypothetical protein RCCGEPOP_36363, partial [Rhizobium sp. Pop5]
MWNLPLRSSAAICWSTRLRSGASGAFLFPLPKSRGDFLDDPIDLLVGDLHLRQPVLVAARAKRSADLTINNRLRSR